MPTSSPWNCAALPRRGRAAAFRRKLAGRRHTDGTELIREDRDR
jgi:hypothetical protein